VAAIGRGFGMDMLAWSRSLTRERAAECRVRLDPLPAGHEFRPFWNVSELNHATFFRGAVDDIGRC
jgi:hypothetical protein